MKIIYMHDDMIVLSGMKVRDWPCADRGTKSQLVASLFDLDKEHTHAINRIYTITSQTVWC